MTKRKAITPAMKLDAITDAGPVYCVGWRRAAHQVPYAEIEFDHPTALGLGGEHRVVPLCADCHALKTYGDRQSGWSDIRMIAKTKRLRGENKPRRKKTIPSHAGGIPSRPMQSRPFEKRKTHD